MRILLITKNTFRGIMSKKALYIWGFALVLMLLRSVPELSTRNLTPEMVLFQRSMAVSQVMDMWSLLSIAAALFLGAATVASDITTKVLMTVLARPIRRWELLTGKWFGIVAFSTLTLAIGVLLAASLGRYLGVEVETNVLAIAMTRSVAGIVLFGGVAVALSALTSTAIAASLTVLLAFSPPLIRMLVDEPGRVQHAIGVGLDYLTPPGYQSHYLGVTWAPFPVPPGARRPPQASRRQPPAIDYPGERQQAAKTLGYVAAYFVIACAAFSRRDIKIS